VREAACVCLSRLITRPDTEEAHVQRFMEWSGSQLRTIASSVAGGRALHSTSEALATGILFVLVECGKHGHRDAVRAHLTAVFEHVLRFGGSSVTDGSTLLRKLVVKFAARVGLTYMPPRVVSWRYQRGASLRSLQ
jgi:hypothetical protein